MNFKEGSSRNSKRSIIIQYPKSYKMRNMIKPNTKMRKCMSMSSKSIDRHITFMEDMSNKIYIKIWIDL